EPVEHAPRPRAEAVPARLVAREGRLVDQGHLRGGQLTPQGLRGHRPRGAAADDEDARCCAPGHPSTLAPGQRRGLRSVTSSAVPGMILLLPGAGVAGSGAGPPAAPASGPAVVEAPAGPAEPDRPDPDPAADPDPAEP